MYNEKFYNNYWRYYETRQEKMFNLATKRKRVTSLLDVGAGVMYVKELIDPDCLYKPLDNIERSYETMVADLNSPTCDLSKEGPFDLGFCSGILEYITDLPRLIKQLSVCCNRLVISYDCTDTPQNMIKDGDLMDFRINTRGYENHYSKSEIIKLISNCGFQVLAGNDFDDYSWQPILYFEKKRRPAIASKRFFKK